MTPRAGRGRVLISLIAQIRGAAPPPHGRFRRYNVLSATSALRLADLERIGIIQLRTDEYRALTAARRCAMLGVLTGSGRWP